MRMAQHRYTPRKLLSWLDGDLEPKTVDAAWASDQTAVPSYFIRERNNRSEPWPRKIPQDWHLLPGWKSARSRSPKPCGVKNLLTSVEQQILNGSSVGDR